MRVFNQLTRGISEIEEVDNEWNVIENNFEILYKVNENHVTVLFHGVNSIEIPDDAGCKNKHAIVIEDVSSDNIAALKITYEDHHNMEEKVTDLYGLITHHIKFNLES